ncbi:MAG: efflux transporter outer membrane subunit [Burkholderiales bacterium]|nr:efflux transporter outer membrane subunit [Burkholderiales bacterium]
MTHHLRRLSAMTLLALSACATQQDIQPKLKRLDVQQWGLDGQAVPAEGAATEALVPSFGDSTLRALIERALIAQPSIQVVQARLAKAQAQAVATRGGELPQIQATAEVDRQHFTENSIYPPPLGGTIRNTGTLQLEGSWELDLFGRQRALVDAAIGQSRAAQADAQAARVLLSSQVARAYVQLARLLAQKDVAQRTLAQRQESLSLIKQRVTAGLDTVVELRLSEGALPDVRQQIEALDEQIAWSRHALAALTGQPPSATDSLTPSIQALQPMTLPATVPVDLLARRADITAARWRAEASGHVVDAARALFYPNIDLRGYLGFNAIGLDRLLESGSRQYGLMPAIHLPLFDGDRRRANLQGNVAEQDAAVASYNQAVIEAVHEVADQLSSIDSLLRQRREQHAAQTSAEAGYDAALQRYRAGLGTYLTVLNAETAVLNQRRLAVDLQARAMDAQVSLVRALGGQAAAQNNNTLSQSGDRS